MTSPIRSLNLRFDVAPLMAQIEANPSVWNRHETRRKAYGPHAALADIWVRYNAWENFAGDPAIFNEEHESVWYPVTAEIPAVKALVFDVMRAVEGERLGGVLITKIPSGEMCQPHRDSGWHASYYEKFAVQLKSKEKQTFCFEGASLSAETGELYTFDNSQTHWVINDSDEDRVTLIICIRRSH